MQRRCALALALVRVMSGGLLLALLLLSRSASAYPWMIRHGYSGCTPCHADPSGGGLLTPYGRAQSELLLRTRYGGSAEEEAGPVAGFAWGAFDLPEWLLLGASFREMGLFAKAEGAPAQGDFIPMQNDLRAQVAFGTFRASGSLGYAHTGALPAAITHRDADNLVSREHWLGLALGEDDAFLLRAGRLELPFGIRDVDHTTFVRTATHTDLDATQQHGIALAWSGTTLRGELMAILGNYQLGPDEYRERGYSGFLEMSLSQHASVGASSLLTYAARDLALRVPNIRQAHGLFVRAAPWEPLVLMGEADALLQTPQGGQTKAGYAALLSADFEAVQGLHAIAAGESQDTDPTVAGPMWGVRFGIDWFFAPHADVRVDAIDQVVPTPDGHMNAVALAAQLHLFL